MGRHLRALLSVAAFRVCVFLFRTSVLLARSSRSAVAYLCGHLHTLGGLMPVLHSRHPHGTLELELGDWMDNRRWGSGARPHV